MVKKVIMVIVMAGLLSSIGMGVVDAAEDEKPKQDDLQAQIDAVKNAIPRFAIPMREIGERFQNMYYAAEEGNWGLAAYMSKYMNAAMNPVKLTRPGEYPAWSSFYSETFAPVNKALSLIVTLPVVTSMPAITFCVIVGRAHRNSPVIRSSV